MISVVIPLYNKEKSVTRAINSVLAQTCPDFDLIIVNDGSTDNSLGVVQGIKDPRIRIVSQENHGISAARNRGVTEADCDWVAFLDADDEWMPDFLANIDELRTKFPACGLVATGFVRKSGTSFDHDQFNKIRYPDGWKGIMQDYYTDLRESVPFFPSSVAVRKHDLIRAGGFPIHMTNGQDIDTWLRLYQVTNFAYYKYIGAIYHLDAENRAYRKFHKAFSKPTDYTIGDLLRQILRKGGIPGEQRASVTELLAMYDLPIIRKLIQLGYRRDALKRLWWLRTSKQYCNKVIKVLMICLLPGEMSRAFGLLPKTPGVRAN